MALCSCWACYKARQLFPRDDELQERFRHAFCVTRPVESTSDDNPSFKDNIEWAENEWKKIRKAQQEKEKDRSKVYKELFGPQKVRLSREEAFREKQRAREADRLSEKKELEKRQRLADVEELKRKKQEFDALLDDFDNVIVFDTEAKLEKTWGTVPYVKPPASKFRNKPFEINFSNGGTVSGRIEKPKQVKKSDPEIDVDLTQESNRKIRFDDE